MNLILQLAHEADKFAHRAHPEQDSYGRPADINLFRETRDKKFAELIVRECCDMVNSHVQHNNPNDCPLVLKIKEHFGVNNVY